MHQLHLSDQQPHCLLKCLLKHYIDLIVAAMASQITSLTIVRSTVYSGADQRKRQSSASLAFVRGIHRGPVNSPHKGPVKRKIFPFDDVIMVSFPHPQETPIKMAPMAPKFQLFYFPICGRGEVVRQVFRLAGVEFEDTRFTPPGEWNEWIKHWKSSKCLCLHHQQQQQQQRRRRRRRQQQQQQKQQIKRIVDQVLTGDPLHSRAACTQPCNVNTHSRAHCSHGCVNNGGTAV